jgi:hypothetical protein
MKCLLLLNEEEFKKATVGLQIKEHETTKYKETTFTFLEASGKETIYFLKVKPERKEHYYVQQEERVFLTLKELLQKA